MHHHPLTIQWRVLGLPDGEGDPARIPSRSDWLPAEVPGNIHLDLRRAGRIPHPFQMDHSKRLRHLEPMEWWYRGDFQFPPASARRWLELVFHGLDTFATVWLNGNILGESRNMFVPFSRDVTDRLANGDNQILVRLRSPLAMVRDKPIDGCAAAYGTTERLWARKCQMSYAWDIAPRLLTAGIWRPVELRVHEGASLDDACFRVRTLSADAVEAVAEIEVAGFDATAFPAQVRVEGQCGPSRFAASARMDKPGRIELPVLVRDPRLWWPRTMGIPNLYRTTVTLADRAGRTLDEKVVPVGLRTVELRQDADDSGRAFRFRVNGRDEFIYGVNWTPPDALNLAPSDDCYERLLQRVVDMGMNMVRVWGGGVYEGDAFYRRCNELGILVWQDFMFACAIYPEHEEFLAEVRAEAESVVRRLRGHPCLAIWCGDNECEDALARGYWGVQRDPRSYKVTREALAGVCARLQPELPYIPSSEFSPDDAWNPNSPDEGDAHLWFHAEPFDGPSYTAKIPRFVSEIGRLSYPSLDSMKEALGADVPWPPGGTLWDHHSGCHDEPYYKTDWCNTIETTLLKFAAEPLPSDPAQYIERSQELQARAYAFWVDLYRRSPRCGGVLLWSLTNPWPAISPAIIEHSGRPKKAFAALRERFGQSRKS